MECRSVTNVIIGKGVASIDEGAFYSVGRFNFNRISFLGNAPVLTRFPPWEPPGVFHPDATIYYLPGTSGWTSSFGGRPTAVWHLPTPTILTLPPYFGVQTNQFGFRVSWATNRTTVIEACTDLASPSWVPLATNSLTPFLWFYFNDPEWTNFPNRIYRVRQQ